LSNKSGISLKTIQDLESRKRITFSESTVIAICKALEIDYFEFVNYKNVTKEVPETPSTGGKTLSLLNVVISALLVIILLIIISIILALFQHRKDYINPLDKSKLPIEGPAGVGTARCQEVINFIDYNPMVLPNDRIRIQIVFSYYYEEGTPMVYISAYTEWEPDKEIRLFDGILKKRGQITGEFITEAPRKPGIYRIRFFWALAYGPIISFYGHPSEDQLSTPMNVPYNEIKIEVMSRNIFDKILAQLPFIF
jgi:DNA-binding Xre family transcriptional regulator